ncbi:TIGR01777 family protein [Marinobacter panjinensis]|uniref:TIGR01777 family protein n=1 Tax=Marinobacter panjinensis TaxID=2576384 RepID=A0A4U6QZQ6_9GAMM|nr:TIGR01777 family oxidoreductase [Marinobacter panjinensis]MCR8915580.1 TIGR01777 family oxidoreductase [Marinobacter panjinensis]TKV66827.1 TIGR01777 family protein [Marinobacter panjinensis]
MEKRILITGGTGFIGQVLCQKLIADGHSLTVLSRQPAHNVQAVCGRVEPLNDLDELRGAEGFDAVINLAGEGIADKRWSEARKQELMDSRIALTNQLVDVIRSWKTLPAVLVSGSAVGFYGDQGSHRVTEDTPPHDEFTHRMCSDWEQAALRLDPSGVRVCLSRTGIVAGPGGGFLQRMLLPFKLGLGGRLGNGEQYMPWIHRDDVVAALIWMMETDTASGAYNVVSPNPVTNRQFTRCLAGVLGRPAIFPAPAPVLKIVLGEMSRLLLTGQMAIPERLEAEGFRFRFPDLTPALADATRY